MNLGLLLAALGLVVGFVIGRRLDRSRRAATECPASAVDSNDARKIFDGLSNDQQWLLARLVDEGSLPVAEWTSCLDAVIFVERDAATGKRRIEREYQDALTRIIKDRQPDIRKAPQNGDLGKSGDVLRSIATAGLA